MKTGKLQIWVPELIAREGGIQSYSIEMVEAAAEILGPRRVTVLSKSDDPKALRIFADGRFQCQATGQYAPPLRTAAFGSMLLRMGLGEDPDLLISTHVHFAPIAQMLFNLRKIPAAVSAHGVEVWDMQAGLARQGLLAVDTILPVSDYTKSRLMTDLRLPGDRFFVIPNTFDPVRFCPGPAPAGLRLKHGLQPEDLVILCVARLEASEQYKGYRQILEVIPSLIQKIPRVRFVMVGRGNDRPNIDRQIQRLQLGDRVVMTGFVSSHELPDYYRMADVFAMPSKREGFGIVYLEAMGCGKMCLGGNKDAAVDALRHGEFGILVDPDNLKDLEEGLLKLLTGPKPTPREIHDRASHYFGRVAFRKKVRLMLEGFGLR